jgi:hypothetical protein
MMSKAGAVRVAPAAVEWKLRIGEDQPRRLAKLQKGRLVERIQLCLINPVQTFGRYLPAGGAVPALRHGRRNNAGQSSR